MNCSGWTWEVVEVVPRTREARTVPFGSHDIGAGLLDLPLASVVTDCRDLRELCASTD